MRKLWESGISVLEDVVFDFRYGLNTASIVPVSQLDIGDEDKAHAVRYKPTRVRYFKTLMKALPLSRDHVFVDVGCGKGRVLLLAARYGFRRSIGLELSPSLCEVAEANLANFRQRYDDLGEVEIHCANVLEHQFSDNETVFFLFWPFDREVTVDFLKILRASLTRNPREVWLIINEFQFPELLEDDPEFQFVKQVDYGASEFRIYRALVEKSQTTVTGPGSSELRA